MRDVYICYDERDSEIADSLSNIFNDNNVSTWLKSKDMSENDSVDKITLAIENSKAFVLILSKNSKDTNYVLIETDIAFSRDIPIIILEIGDVTLDGNLEFILESQIKFSAFPDSRKQLGSLVKNTSATVGKIRNDVKISRRDLKAFDKINPKRHENSLKKYLKIIVPVAVILVLVYLFVIVPTGQNTTEDGVFAMNVTDVDVSDEFKYTVFGQSYNLPADSVNYFMNIQFFDEKDNLVYEVNSTADEFKSGVICEANLKSDNVTHIGFKLTDMENKVLSKQDYQIS